MVRVLLFVWDVSMLRECQGDGNADVVCVYMGGIRGSGSVPSGDDVLERIEFYQSCGNRRSVERVSGVGLAQFIQRFARPL